MDTNEEFQMYTTSTEYFKLYMYVGLLGINMNLDIYIFLFNICIIFFDVFYNICHL